MPSLHSPLRIFVSGTDVDLVDHRTLLKESILLLDQFPQDMRYFGPQPTGNAITLSVAELARADLVILLIAWRYGTVDPITGLSITHQEYQEAIRLQKPLLVFLAADATRDDPALFPFDRRDPQQETKLLAFREEVRNGGHVLDATFTTPDDLARKVTAALGKYMIKLLQQQQLVTPVLRSLPPRVPNFVGREQELRQIEVDLLRGQHTAVAAAVAGMGGVGKSALAAEAFIRIAHDESAFPGGMTWVRCNDLSGWQGVSAICTQLLLDWNILLSAEDIATAHTPEQEAEIRVHALRARLQLAGPALVLLDNVEHDLPLKEILPLMASLQVTVLMTTRTIIAHSSVTIHRLDVLTPAEAQTLLRARFLAKGGHWTESQDEVPALGVVHALGGLPLAIDLAAARAARQGKTISDLNAELHQAETLPKLSDPADPTAGVKYVLGLSLDLLPPDKRICFESLGLVSVTDYPQAAVLFLFAALLGQDHVAAEDTNDLLITLSLMQSRKVGQTMRAQLHPLLHELAAGEWRKRDAAIHITAVEGLLRGLNSFIRAHHNEFTVLAHDELLCIEMLRYAAQVGCYSEALIHLTEAIDQYLDLQGRWELRGETLLIQLATFRALKDLKGESVTLNLLGWLANRLGRYGDATEYYAQALAIQRESGDRVGEGMTLMGLGILAKNQGRHDAAADYYAQALMIQRALADRVGEGRALNNLGELARRQGDFGKAAVFLTQSLTIRRELGNRSGESTTLNNLGELAVSQGRFDEAADYYAQSLAIRQEQGNRPGQAHTLHNLGELAQMQGQYAEAASCYERALAIRREVGNRSGEGLTLNNIGELAQLQGQYEEAAVYYKQSLTILSKLGNQSGKSTALNNMGTLAQLQRQYEEAVTYYEQSLAIRRELGNRAGEGQTLNNLGTLSEEQGQFKQALRYYEHAFVLLAPIEHMLLATVRKNVERMRQLLRQHSAIFEPAAQAPSVSAVTTIDEVVGNAEIASADEWPVCHIRLRWRWPWERQLR